MIGGPLCLCAKSLREDSKQRAVEDPVVEAVDELLDERSANATVEPLKRSSADAKAQQGGNHNSTWRKFLLHHNI